MFYRFENSQFMYFMLNLALTVYLFISASNGVYFERQVFVH
jgi:hypothetical protein